jgi:hypothetical protein
VTRPAIVAGSTAWRENASERAFCAPLLMSLHSAACGVERSCIDAHIEAAGTILQEARRALYRLRAGYSDA